jgi:hypothetical protein
VLQAPGAALGSWAVLGALLQPTGTNSPFLFREPLGQSREVKVALSGLFGRFVARAYLERYFRMAVFAHLGARSLVIDARRKIRAVKSLRGDFPDWVASDASFSTIFIAEAKGCHDPKGPEMALERAWNQAQRVDIFVDDRRATVKRIAIATRWGAFRGGSSESILHVRDPNDAGEHLSGDEQNAILVGIARAHVANLLKPLGHTELANTLKALNTSPFPNQQLEKARAALEKVSLQEVLGGAGSSGPTDALIGGLVTRAGPLQHVDLSLADRQTLSRLELRPRFVGFERRFVAAVVDGQLDQIRKASLVKPKSEGELRSDPGGAWVIELGGDIAIKI